MKDLSKSKGKNNYNRIVKMSSEIRSTDDMVKSNIMSFCSNEE